MVRSGDEASGKVAGGRTSNGAGTTSSESSSMGSSVSEISEKSSEGLESNTIGSGGGTSTGTGGTNGLQEETGGIKRSASYRSTVRVLEGSEESSGMSRRKMVKIASISGTRSLLATQLRSKSLHGRKRLMKQFEKHFI